MRKKMKWNVFGVVFLVVLGLSFYPVMSAHAYCPEDLFSYWPLDESAGPGYEDVVGKNSGVGSLDPTAFAQGQVGGAQYFNGLNQSIEVSASQTFGWLASSSFSIELWAKPDGVVGGTGFQFNQVMIGRGDGDMQWWLGILNGDGEPFFVLTDGSAAPVNLSGPAPLFDAADPDAWYHLVVVRDGASGATTLYVNGSAVATQTRDFTNGFSSQTAPLYIGQFGADDFFYKGWLDEVALYDRALLSTEIMDHYIDGLAQVDYCQGAAPPSVAPYPEDTVSFWPLDESAGPDYEDVVGKNSGVGSLDPMALPEGQVGGAQYFDGLDRSIEVSASHTFGWLASSSFSIELWAKPDGVVGGTGFQFNQVMIGRGDGDMQWWLGILNGDGEPFFALTDGTAAPVNLIGPAPLFDAADPDAWYHLVVVRDGASGATTLYVNGSAVATQTRDFTNGFSSQTAPLYIGQFGADDFFYKGWLDEVALYDRALEPDEIEDHFTAGLTRDGVTSLRPPPIADAGADQNVNEGAEVTLSAGGSEPGYPGASSLSFLWTQIPPTPPLLVDNVAASTVVFNAPEEVAGDAETFTFQLMVTANDGQIATDSVQVTVSVAPVAAAGENQNVTAGEPVTLSAAGSTGTGLTYLWTQISPADPLLVDKATTDTVVFNAPGDVVGDAETFTFELTVTDQYGFSATNSVNVTVSVAPVAAAGDRQDVTEGDDVTLSAAGSTGAGPLAYLWTQISPMSPLLVDNVTDETVEFEAPEIVGDPVTFTFELTVTDQYGFSDTALVEVEVSAAPVVLPDPPVANAGVRQDVTAGATVNLDGNASTGGTDLAYVWTQISPTDPLLVDNVTGATFSFTAPGIVGDPVTFTFALTVTDLFGQSAIAEVEITVFAPVGPEADAGGDQSVVQRNLVTLDGSGSTGSGTLSFSWIQTDGPIVTLTGADTDTATFTAPEVDAAGEILAFTLTVTDDQGLSDTDTVEVTVSAFAPGGGGGSGGCFINSMF